MDGTKRTEYSHRQEGDILKVRIEDFSRRTIYKNKINIRDKNAILNFLCILEKFSGLSINQILKEKLKIDEWW